MKSDTLAALQQHTCQRPLALPENASALFGQLRKALQTASDQRRITTSPRDIHGHLRLLRGKDIDGKVLDDLQQHEASAGAFCILGGVKNQARDPSLPSFRRDDGAWFDFTITAREKGKGLELLAYDFEIRFPPGTGTSFLRFDLNLPDHRNQARDLRCHLHPGSDDILLPAPLLDPMEMVHFLVEGVRHPSDRGKRTPTSYEITWLKETLAALAPTDKQGDTRP